MPKTLITGAAGFIGYHLCKRLIQNNEELVGIDNLNDYYDVNLKKDRISDLNNLSQKISNSKWHFYIEDIVNYQNMFEILSKEKPKIIIHLAAQAGVRYSLKNPRSYINSNLVGFSNILELCREFEINNLLYASSSSVYGGNTKIPFSEKDSVDHPVSLYAATKRSNELMAHTYSHLFKIKTTGMRFFTVYGPWGRPDMAPMIFTKAILSGKQIHVFNNGQMSRDFTYIDDVINAIMSLREKPASPYKDFNRENPIINKSWAPFKIFNIGNTKSINLLEFIKILENKIGLEAKKVFEEMSPGDIEITSSNIDEIKNWINFNPTTDLNVGIEKFVTWYKEYYRI